MFGVFAVAINDAAAYFVGISMGKTPLIKISPKKTREGFIGGVVGSFILCFFMTSYLSNNLLLICPQTDFGFEFFERITCVPPDVFVAHRTEINLGPLGLFSMNIASI